MKNSDLFLELFDDDLLKPQQEKDVDKTTEQAGEVLKSEVGISKVLSNRTEFDLCEALDQIKDERVLKHKQVIEKHQHKLSLNKDKSLVHQGDTDSSEDDDNKYMDSYNYCEFGRDVKRMLTSNSNVLPYEEKVETVKLSHKWAESTSKAKKEIPSTTQMSLPDKPVVKTCDAYADPFFGIRIMTPLISSQGIQIRMSGKTPVTLAKLQAHLAKKVESDFVVAGVIVRSVTKVSQNDNQYMIWEISDLTDELPCVSVFLFGNSYKCLWKTQTGTVVGILNPTTGNKKGGNGSDSFSISVKFTDQVMIWGHSKDYGICKSIKKSGEKCTAFVNKNRCEFCIYHVKKEYTKFSSSRSEIQPPLGGRNTNFLRNKVLGKNEVFYGGKSYTALKEPLEKTKGKSKKLCLKDQQTLSNLGVTVFEKKTEIKSNTVSLPPAPRAALVLQNLNMDSKILKSLSSSKKPETPISFKISSSSFNLSSLNSKTDKVPKLSDPNLSINNKVPKLSKPKSISGIDHSSTSCTGNKLDKPLNSEESFKAKIPALTNPEIQDLNLNKSENIVSRRSKLLFEEAVTKNKSPKSNTKNKLYKPFAGVNGSKAKIPSLNNPDIGDLNLNKSENVSSRSKLLFEEAVTKNDSPKSNTKNKFRKPSLSNPELNESPKADNESKTPSSKMSSCSKKELFSTRVGDLNCKRSQGPVLSDPSGENHKKMSDSNKLDSKDKNKGGKELQKMFKSLFEVACNQKKKTLVSYNSNISASDDDKKQSDVRINKDNTEQINLGLNDRTATSSAEVRMKEKVLNDNSADSLKSNSKPLDNKESIETSSTPTQKPVYRNDSPSQCRVNTPFPSPSAPKVSKAKTRALMFIKQNGPISKCDPNALKKATDSSVKKRVRSSEPEESTEGKPVFSELYLQLMKQTSQQQDLAEAERLRLEEEYFDKMGLKEQLEEKMLNTFKIDCKAVKCLQCKYIWFSAADICKTERHILKIVDTVKRFFKCGNCGNRTVSLHVLPMFSCNNCSSSNWQRAPMMREKIVRVNNQLSIRGGEQQFLNSQATNSNLNLLVPD